MSELLSILDDDKPTIVRQALEALRAVILFKPRLSEAIETKLDSMDNTKYKDSMKPLIEKDILGLKEMV